MSLQKCVLKTGDCKFQSLPLDKYLAVSKLQRDNIILIAVIYDIYY